MTQPASKSTPHAAGNARTRALDRFAIALSGLCLVHCMAVPVALFMGPLLGGWLAESETTVHWVLLALAVPSTALALGSGYSKHRNSLTVVLGAAGLAIMFAGVAHLFGRTAEVVLTTIGVTLLLVAHVRNMLHLSGHGPAGGAGAD